MIRMAFVKENLLSKVLYDYGRYYVTVCDDVEDGNQTVKGYGVFNKETGVREYSDVAYFQCVRNARLWEQFAKDGEAFKYDPNDTIWDKGTPEPVLKNLN